MSDFRASYPKAAGRFWPVGLAVVLLGAAGCGTTRWSDTSRTATEQLVISNAIDRAVNEINFEPLAGKEVYFDAQYLKGVTDEHYVVSSLMQHMLSYGCILKESRHEAEYVVVARAGVVGTNRHDVMLGVPSVNLPTVTAISGVPSAIPEIPFAKTTEQKGVAKIAVFAMNRHTGQAVWQSGAFPVTSSAKDTWIFGTGPFQRGSIYQGTQFPGEELLKPFRGKSGPKGAAPDIPVTAEAVFSERPRVATRPGKTLAPPIPDAAARSKTSPPAGVQTANLEPMSGANEPLAATGQINKRHAPTFGKVVRLPPTDQSLPATLDAQDKADEIDTHAPPSDPPGERLAAPRRRGFSWAWPPRWLGGASRQSVDESKPLAAAPAEG